MINFPSFSFFFPLHTYIDTKVHTYHSATSRCHTTWAWSLSRYRPKNAWRWRGFSGITRRLAGFLLVWCSTAQPKIGQGLEKEWRRGGGAVRPFVHECVRVCVYIHMYIWYAYVFQEEGGEKEKGGKKDVVGWFLFCGEKRIRNMTKFQDVRGFGFLFLFIDFHVSSCAIIGRYFCMVAESLPVCRKAPSGSNFLC